MSNESKSDENILHDLVEAETGLSTKSISDNLRYHESDQRGTVLVELVSHDQLEEDLRLVDVGESLLGKETIKTLVHDTYRDFLNTLGKYLPEDKLQKLFPGLDLAELDEYDLGLSTIKTFVFPHLEFLTVEHALRPKKDSDSDAMGFHKGSLQSKRGTNSSDQLEVDVGEHKVIVIDEIPIGVQEIINKITGRNSLEGAFTQDELMIMELNAKATLFHELVHIFNVAYDLPTPLIEGITEWYAQQLTMANAKTDPETLVDKVVVGYSKYTEVVSTIMESLLQNGFTFDSIDKAFLSRDDVEIAKITKFLEEVIGPEALSRIVNWHFESANEALTFIKNLPLT